MGGVTDATQFRLEKPEGKSPRGRPKIRWEDNIKLYLRETVFEGVDWINIDHWRHVANMIVYILVP
jgi:hypothetical protein